MSERYITISKNEIIFTVILILYFLICLLLMKTIPGAVNWLGIFIFAYCVYTYKKRTGMKWLNPYTIFQLFMIMFNYGQPIMWAFGIHRISELGTGILFANSGYIPTKDDLLSAQIYTCLSMLIFHFGVLCFTHKKRRKIQSNTLSSIINREELKSALRNVCGLLLIIIAPIAIIFRFYEVQIARQYGYIALYYGENSTQTGYIKVVLYFFFPAIVGYLIGNDYSKKSRLIAHGIFGIYAVLSLLSGDRGNWLYSLFVLLWLHTLYRKTPLRKYIKYGLLGILLLYVMNIFVSVRDSELNIKNGIINHLFLDNSPIVDAFFETGGTMGIITFLLKKGNKIYPYENTYLTSLLGAVSSRVLNFLGINQVLLANWFSQDYLHISWGTGFSMLGEAFVNGGYIGGLGYMLALGCIHGKLFNLSGDLTINDSPLRVFLVASGLNVMLGLIRGAMYLTLKELFWGVFVTYACVKIVALVKRRRRVNE